MIQIISGRKGKGKTKVLIDKANTAAKEADGSIVYLDKSAKHMYELNNQIRLINVLDYDVDSNDKFTGFVSGLIASNHDLQHIFLDSFLKLASLEGEDMTSTIAFLDKIGATNDVKFVLSVSADESEIPEDVRKFVEVSL